MDPVIKKRHFAVRNVRDAKMARALERELLAARGVLQVDVIPFQALYITYDLMEIKLDDIVGQLKKLGYPMAPATLLEWWKGWVDFTEANEYDSMTSPMPNCCSNPRLTHRQNGKRVSRDEHHEGGLR